MARYTSAPVDCIVAVLAQDEPSLCSSSMLRRSSPATETAAWCEWKAHSCSGWQANASCGKVHSRRAQRKMQFLAAVGFAAELSQVAVSSADRFTAASMNESLAFCHFGAFESDEDGKHSGIVYRFG